jgi:hypothetical protein
MSGPPDREELKQTAEQQAAMEPPRQAPAECSGCGQTVPVWFWGTDARVYCVPCARTRKIIR